MNTPLPSHGDLQSNRQSSHPCGAAVYNQKAFDASPEAIRLWIRTLPLADSCATTQQTTDALRRLNHGFISIDEHARALALFSPLINTLIKRLDQHYPKSQRLLTGKRRKYFEAVQTMLNEIVHSYLIIVNESPLPSPLPTPAGTERDVARHNARSIPLGSATHHLCYALYQAIEHLAQRLLHSHLVYTAAPASVWSELHRLYYIAETYNITATPFTPGFNVNSEQHKTVTIEHAYKHILLFSLANPYHLMPNEISSAYQSLRSWTPQCKIIRSDSPEKLQGRFYIDLESDLPPTHYTLNRKDIELPSLRLLDIDEILPAAQYQRALDRRLAQALIIRPERISKRIQSAAEITLASGLSACHHYVSNEYKNAASKPYPYRIKHSSKALNHHNPVEAKMASRGSHHTTFCAQQQNISLGGFALHHNDPLHSLTTGALITFKQITTDQRDENWNIGVIKWSRSNFDKGYDLGIKCLAENGAAVVMRPIDNNGNGTSPYHPALLTPNIDPLTYPTTLITPAGHYKVGDTVQIHAERQQLHVEITQLIDTTWAYSHYRFRVIASRAH